ncbi:c-type cytochrome [Alkalilimnicola ehrlichii MLHE-1]|uniref:Cytochrome c, class I n=1 Tax=Alkalilimnicola ehrlichii (strain ATCC BAA-1101 / DSM 17681 / MLHE-1) TaxID=187272 RepID=Q0A9R4_ALKEH|nr:cytochrome c [Alkalilimnicola ehrlichii]ABI56423.1 cytochrome c, class I [Alkalilimnicola ehrlichii MLHE-1]
MFRKMIVSVAVGGALLASGAAVAGDPERGEQLATTCFACHGAQGRNDSPQYPQLAQQNEEYILIQLQNFQDGSREDPLMSPQAAQLTEQDKKDLAAYFTAQTLCP